MVKSHVVNFGIFEAVTIFTDRMVSLLTCSVDTGYNYSRVPVSSRVHNRKREESIALAYHPCAKFSGGQVGANMSESACG